jgi:heme exporter protein B
MKTPHPAQAMDETFPARQAAGSSGVKPFMTLIARDVRLAWREGGAVGTALGFYLVVVALLPLGVGPNLKLLSQIAPGVLWVSLLLSALLSLERIFQTDYEDGTLDVLATGPLPLELVVLAKSIAHWLSTGLPLVLMSPVLGLLLNLEGDRYGPLMLSMAVGTPAVSFLGAVGAALTCGLRRSGLLLALLLMPLYVPVVIFGVSAAVGGGAPAFAILGAFTLASAIISPIAAGAAIRGALS